MGAACCGRIAGRRRAALGLLLLLSPLLLAIALWVRLDSPGPALFRQPRVGLDRRVFTAYKFRTMRRRRADDGAHRRLIEAELRGEDTCCDGSTKLADDPRSPGPAGSCAAPASTSCPS